MATVRAVCPACSLPLSGELVASSCNGVFHRKCHPPKTPKCPKCHEHHGCSASLDLFGVSFGEDTETEEPTVLVEVDGALVAGADPEVVELCKLRDEASEQQRLLAEMRAKVATAQLAAFRQQEKLLAAEKQATKRASDHEKLAAELEECKKKHTSLCQQAEHVRQRDAVLEYWEELRGKGPAEAFTFLACMVGMVTDPSKILTEVARLRDYHRAGLAKWQKEAAAATRREAKAHRELQELQRAVAEVRSKLAARGGAARGVATADSELPAAKRQKAL